MKIIHLLCCTSCDNPVVQDTWRTRKEKTIFLGQNFLCFLRTCALNSELSSKLFNFRAVIKIDTKESSITLSLYLVVRWEDDRIINTSPATDQFQVGYPPCVFFRHFKQRSCFYNKLCPSLGPAKGLSLRLSIVGFSSTIKLLTVNFIKHNMFVKILLIFKFYTHRQKCSDPTKLTGSNRIRVRNSCLQWQQAS